MYSNLGDYMPYTKYDDSRNTYVQKTYINACDQSPPAQQINQNPGGCMCNSSARMLANNNSQKYFNTNYDALHDPVKPYDDKPYFTYHPHMRTPLANPFARYVDDIVEYFPRRGGDSYRDGCITTVLHIIIAIILALILFSMVCGPRRTN